MIESCGESDLPVKIKIFFSTNSSTIYKKTKQSNIIRIG